MKKKLAVLLGVLVLSSVSFAAPKPAAGGSSIENSLNNLENQLTKLQQMEDAKYRQQEAEANEDTSIFGKEFKAKAAEYKNLRNQLDKEIAKEQQIISDFEVIKSLK